MTDINKENNFFMDISSVISALVQTELEQLITSYKFEVKIKLEKENFIMVNNERIEVPFYPIDSDNTNSVSSLISKLSSGQTDIAENVYFVVKAVTNTIKVELDKVDGNCTIHFSPCQEIEYANTEALYVYSFIANNLLFSETSFIVVKG